MNLGNAHFISPCGCCAWNFAVLKSCYPCKNNSNHQITRSNKASLLSIPWSYLWVSIQCPAHWSANLPKSVQDILYNPQGGSQYDPNNPTWATWVEQLQLAGVDFVCPNLTGSFPQPANPPSQIAPFVAAVNNRGLANQLKFAIFDDNAASWCAHWNMANGRGFLPSLRDRVRWTFTMDKWDD